MRAKTMFPLAALAGLLALSGCLAPVADPGANPARLNLGLKAKVSEDQVRRAVRTDPLQPMGRSTSSGVFGPNWHLDAYLVGDQGQDQRLPLAPGADFSPPAGYSLDQRAGFLLPPGPQVVRLVLRAEVTHAWQERVGPDAPVLNRQGQATYYEQPDWRQRSAIVPVQEWRREIRLDLAPGQAQDLTWP